MTEFVIESLSGFPPFISHFALGLAMLVYLPFARALERSRLAAPSASSPAGE